MPVIPFIEEKAGEMRAVFEDLHRHPEIGFEEQHASGVVASLLENGASMKSIPALRRLVLSAY